MSRRAASAVKRLQVLFDPVEYAEIQAAAERQGVTVAEFVRTTLREARRRAPERRRRGKLDAIRRAASCSFPVSDIETMLGEIESGYRSEPKP